MFTMSAGCECMGGTRGSGVVSSADMCLGCRGVVIVGGGGGWPGSRRVRWCYVCCEPGLFV